MTEDHGERIDHRETMGEHLADAVNLDNWNKASNQFELIKMSLITSVLGAMV